MEGGAAEALARATAAVELDPNSPDAQRQLGVAAATMRRFDEAAAAFQAWSRLDPENPAPLFARARVLSLNHDLKGAQDAGRAALALDPAHPRGLRLMAQLALTAGNQAQAQSFLRRAVQARPESAGLHTLLAETLFRRGLLAPAAQAARVALGLDRSAVAALAVLVRSHLVRGQLLQARAALEQFDVWGDDQDILEPLRAELALKLQRRASKLNEDTREPQSGAFPILTREPAASDADVPPDRPKRRAASLDHLRATTTLDVFDHIAIIRALILRNLRLKYRDNSLGPLLEFARPTAVVVAHYYMFLLLKKPMPGEVPIQIFVIAGFPVWFAFNGAVEAAMNAGNAPGRATLLPGVTTLHLQLSRAIWSWWVNLVFCLAACPLLNLYGAQLPLPNIEMTLLIFFISGTMGFGFGMLAEQLGDVWPVTRIAEKLLMWLFFITSGMYYSAATTNQELAPYFLLSPLLHLVEFERNAFDPGYPVGLVNLAYPAAFAVALPMLGLLAMRNNRNAVHA